MPNKNNYSLFNHFLILILSCYFINTAFAEEKPRHHFSAEECKVCHEDIYSQWKGSMHATSTALKDPIHGAFYKDVIGDPEQEGIKNIPPVYNVMPPVSL